MDGSAPANNNGDKENQDDVSRQHHTTTPSRRRVNLGTPANYYFKYMNSSNKSVGDANSSMFSNTGDDGDTGTISIPGLHLGGEENKTETSYLSMAAGSSSGSEASDLLNKSTLSDTTELTASNFVLVSTSKQQMARSTHERRKTERELKAAKALEILAQEASESVEQQPVDGKVNDKTRGLTEEIRVDITTTTTTLGLPAIPTEAQALQMTRNDDTNLHVGVRQSSPSLRSRVGSSPASLRKFHEDLRNSRMKRQIQREEEAKRRLSNDSASSIPFMHAQLEALTTDTNFSRQRLPPPFTQPAQQSPANGINESSPFNSVDLSNNDSTSFIDMEELDVLLGITHNKGDQRRKSSITAHHSSVVQHLGPKSVSEIQPDPEKLKSSVAKDSPKSDIEGKATDVKETVPDKLKGLTADIEQEPISLQKPETQVTSPVVSKFRRTPKSGTKLTPGRLSSGPKRVANSQSIFSPAKNTRSSKKSVDNDKELFLQVDINNSTFSPAAKDPSTSQNDVVEAQSIDKSDLEVGSPNAVGRPSSTKSVTSSYSGRSDDTASLNDIEQFFGESPANAATAFTAKTYTDTDLGRSLDENLLLNDSNRNEGSLTSHEPVSIEEIQKVLGPDSTGVESRVNLSGGSANSRFCRQTDNILINSEVVRPASSLPIENSGGDEGFILETKDTVFSPRISLGDVAENRMDVSAVQSQTSSGVSVIDAFDEKPKDSLDNKYKSETVNDSNQSQEKTTDTNNFHSPFKPDVGNDIQEKSFGSPTNDSPTTPPKVDFSKMSPSVSRLLSQQRAGRATDMYLASAEKRIADLDSSILSMKDPMRLVPNSHVAPTPTKLAPTPRRVLNPNNPNSPARNTRSSIRNGRSPLNHIGSPTQLDGGKRQRDSLAKPAQLFLEEGTLRSSKRRRSSTATTMTSAIGDARPQGILSSRKKHWSSHRSVAFGSPKAAEYNVGSPSVSLTPMPRGRAKALFRLPSGEENNMKAGDLVGDYYNCTGKGQKKINETMEIESDLNVLVDRISAENMNDSPELSPIAQRKSDTDIFNVDVSSSSSKSLTEEDQGRTVELEVGMDSLIDHAMSSPGENEAESPSEIYGQETSMEMTDADTIASMHSRRSEKFTTEFALPIGQKLDFSVASEESSMRLDKTNMSVDEDEGVTVELEGKMMSLIDANKESLDTGGGIKTTEVITERSMSASPTTDRISALRELRTIDLEANMTDLIVTAKDVGTNDIHSHNIELVAPSATCTNDQNGDSRVTTELEGNISMLLAIAGGNSETNDRVLDENEPTIVDKANESCLSFEGTGSFESTGRNSRRLSLSSSSFKVDQPNQLKVSVDDVEQGSIKVNDKSVSFCDTNEFIVSVIPSSYSPIAPQRELDALTRDQVSNFGSKLFQKLRHETESQGTVAGDALSRFGNTGGSNDIIVFERLRQFVELVCNEVESNTDPSGTAQKSLKVQIDEEPKLFSILNKKLVDCDEDEVVVSLDDVIGNGRKAVEFEWNDWLKTVLESFQTPLANIPQTLLEDVAKLDDALNKCNQYQDNIATMNDRRSELARKKSILRRQEAVRDLEQEIKEMENQVSLVERDLASLVSNEMHVETERRRFHESCRLATTNDELRVSAEVSQKAYLSLRGLHSWVLGTIGEAEMKVATLGACAQTNSDFSYRWEGSTSVAPHVEIAGPNTSSNFRYQGTLSSYLDVCVRALSIEAARQPLSGTSLIGSHIRKYAWLVGRLDLAAKELYVLQKRYKGKIVRTSKENFLLRVNFSTESVSLDVDFPLDPLYPSFPVEVRLELISGGLDFSEVQRSLVKQAKPGFGSLSRACNIVQSFVAFNHEEK